MKKIFFILYCSLLCVQLQAQIGLGITTPHPNAYFQVNSTTRGVLLPRMSALQRLAIAPAPTANGLIVFDTDSSAYMFWTGSVWRKMGGEDGNWIKSGNNIFNSNTGRVGIGISTPAARLHVADSAVLFSAVVNGLLNSTQPPPAQGRGIRMMWHPHKAAFRVGAADDGQLIGFPGSSLPTAWDDINLGRFSFATGFNTVASADYSFASGRSTVASAEYSFASGRSTVASADGSTAIGVETSALGPHSFAGGVNTIANGLTSFVFGQNAIANGSHSLALGTFANAGGANGIAIGRNAATSNEDAVAIGYQSNASGVQSFAIGSGAVSAGFSSIAIGRATATIGSTSAVAIGDGARAEAPRGYAIGEEAFADNVSLRSLAMGYRSRTRGQESVAIGKETSAGLNAAALGWNCTANAEGAFAAGYQSNVLSRYGVAIGINASAEQEYAMALGRATTAFAPNSLAAGYGTRSYAVGSTVLGMFNEGGETVSVFPSPNDRLLQVGNGNDPFSRSNALTLLRNGYLGLGRSDPQAVLHIKNLFQEKIVFDEDYSSGSSYGIAVHNNTLNIHKPIGTRNFMISSGSAFSNTPNLFIDGSFNNHVGLGTATPQAALHIDNPYWNKLILTGTTANYAGFSDISGAVNLYSGNRDISLGGGDGSMLGNQIYINTGLGYVGIGTNSPNQSLSVNNGVNIDHANVNNGTVANSLTFGNNISEGIGSNRNTAVNQFGLDFYTAAIKRLSISNSGNIGIGTTTPTMPLSFASLLGNKIALWGTNPNNHYGFGIQGFLMQMYCGDVSDNIAFGYGSSNNFTERMRITGTGNVGIGITTPAYRLHLGNAGSSFRIEGPAVSGTSGKALSVGGYGDIEVDRPGVVGGRFTIRENGNIGVGVNDPFYILDVNGRMRIRSGGSNAVSAGIWLNNNANNNSPGFMGMESDDAIGFFGNGTPNGWGLVMRIASGNVGIGTSAPSQKLHVIGNILATGTITPSDIRYKKEITSIASPLEKIEQLHGVTYRMKTDAFPEWQFDSTLQYGLIAQEVEKVFPEMVKTISAEGYKGIDYVKMVPVLIEGLKTLRTEQRQLAAENEQLKQRLSLLEDKINTLIVK